MFCRCRYLRAYHLESLLPAALPSIPTRYGPAIPHTSRRFSHSSPDSSSHGKKILHDDDGHVFDITSLVGSIRSPLAFKPFPPHIHEAPLPDQDVDLEPEPNEEEPPPPVTLHSSDPLLPQPHKDTIESPSIAGDAGDSSITDSEDADADPSRPWVDYVKQLKIEKRTRQKAKAKDFLNPAHAIEQWDYMRTWNRSHIANLSVLRWTLLAKAGCQLNEPSVLYNLPGELVDAHANSPRAQVSMVGRVLRNLIPIDEKGVAKYPMFDPLTRPWDPRPRTASEAKATFQRNLDYLSVDLFSEYYQDKPSFVAKLPRDMIFRLVVVAAYGCPQALKHGGLLSAFFAAVHRDGPKLLLAFPLRDPTPLDDAPTGHVWALFRLVQVYFNSESQREAFRLFQRLVQEKMITPSAISQVTIGRGDPRAVILFAMTRTCLDYEWNTGALELMILAAEHDPTVFHEQMRPLVNETLYVLLKQATLMSPAPKYNVRMSAAVQRKATHQAPAGPRYLLRRIIALITALRRDHQAFEIEDKVVQVFYAVARQLDFHHAAEVLFSIGRIYMPFSIPAPSVLVSPSFEVSDDPSSGYISPVEPNHTIFNSTTRPTSPPDGPQPTVASEDSPEPSALNTKYPVPRGPPLLWFLEGMLKESKNVHLSRRLAKEVVESNVDIPVYDRGQFIRLLASAGFAQAGKELWMRYSRDETQGVIGHAGAMIRLVSLFSHLGKDLEAKEAMVYEGSVTPGSSFVSPPDPGGSSEDDDVEVGVIDGDDAKALFDADAAKGFAKEVVDKFRACKVPIEGASRHDLNALARAYFMTDRTEEGFSHFEMVKAARSPDMHDVNVVLSGVAGHNAGLASKMIDRMHERGLVPDAVTWGTVIHLTYLKGETELMISLVKRAQERGISKFTSRTISSLIRASVSEAPAGSQLASHAVTLGSKKRVGSLQLTFGGEGGIEQIRRNLDIAWHLMETLDTQTYVGTWSLAKFCLDRAVWVGDAELAFRFWDKYLGWKTQWSDGDQARSRKRLYELVATAKKEKKLETLQATNMLRKLSGTEP